MTNTELLNKKIDESGLKRRYIAEKMGLSRYGLAKKITNESSFYSEEIMCLCDLLNITSLEEREQIFFVRE